jgi:integrase
MLGKQAKILSPLDVADVLAFTDCTRHPIRNRVIVLLSAKAGLRAGEIAGLTWDMVLAATGHSLLERLGWSTTPAAHCATSSC